MSFGKTDALNQLPTEEFHKPVMKFNVPCVIGTDLTPSPPSHQSCKWFLFLKLVTDCFIHRWFCLVFFSPFESLDSTLVIVDMLRDKYRCSFECVVEREGVYLLLYICGGPGDG